MTVIGWVVLTNEVKDGPPKWQPDWDGEVHTDKVSADEQLRECRDAGRGRWQAVLAEVQVPPTASASG